MAETNTDQRAYRFIISGGGTGGHVFPAIAIANAIKELRPESEILFVGAKGRMEMEKVPLAGYNIIGLSVIGLNRKQWLKNLALPFKLFSSLWNTRKIIKNFKPDLLIGVGGYASAPTLYMAGKQKLPYIIQEQNSYPGLSNRIWQKKQRKFAWHTRVWKNSSVEKKFFGLAIQLDKIFLIWKPKEKKLLPFWV